MLQGEHCCRSWWSGHGASLELAAERLVQQGLFQVIKSGELLLVDGFEALGICFKFHDCFNNAYLLCMTGQGDWIWCECFFGNPNLACRAIRMVDNVLQDV